MRKARYIFMAAMLCTLSLAGCGGKGLFAPLPAPIQESRAARVSVGDAHTCAVTPSGGVKCWGRNYFGELGDGTNTDRHAPVDVVGLTSGVTSISTGIDHTCALTTTGGVKCWGGNYFGQLGDGTTTYRNTPVDVVGLTSGIASVSSGGDHTCAVTNSGGVKCWGDNDFGQLGDGTYSDSYVPVDVVDLTSGIISVSTGYRHTCAVTTSGGVKCWGDNDFGQLGDGTYSDSYVPVDVVDLTSGIISVSTGYRHTCAVTTSGGVKCWGSNYYGELGDGTTTYSNIPVDVVGLTSGVAFASSGYRHTCAVTTSGGVKCWGWNENGQLGVGTTRRRYTPVDVVGLTSGIASISSGGRHICAVTTSGGVKCWGSNKNGQLGDGTTTNSYTPVDVVGLTSGVASVSSGNLHTCAVTNSGGVKCWGSNYYSQLGDGSDISRYTPVDVVGLTSGVASVSSGNLHTCALTSSEGVKCWGNNDYGQLGDGTTTDSNIPVDVVGLTSGIASVSSGVDHTCAVTNSGGVKCWGSNFIGKLGDGTSTDSYMPVDVVELTSGVDSVSSGNRHTCAVTTSGGVKCWGNNDYGQLGDGTTTNSYIPVDVVGLTSGIASVSSGVDHTCAVTNSGGVKCWGSNFIGMLGDGTSTDSYMPVDVVGLTSGVASISSVGNHTCAVTTSGGVKCWGDDYYGQLGDGTTTDSYTPVDVEGLTSGIASISSGGGHTCAVTTSGGVKCWGDNLSGQLGINPGWTPVNVIGF